MYIQTYRPINLTLSHRAVLYLEGLELTPETETMWNTLSQLSLESRQLHVAQRCYAALGNVSRVRYVNTANVNTANVNTANVSPANVNPY